MSGITLIGSGNVAWHLGQAFTKAGHSIESVYSQSLTNAEILAKMFPECMPTNQLYFSQSKSEVFIVAIKDQVLEEVLSSLLIPSEAIIAHTSGSMSMGTLERFKKHGVFYPLQTFTKGKYTDLSKVPFGIEASDEITYQVLTSLARSISENVQPISSHQRKVLHIAAVFACNFTNHLFTISADILRKENLTFDLLKPLVEETVRKAFEIGPEKGQTGPAIRGDKKVMVQHLEYLSNQPAFQEVYKLISERISISNI